MDVIICTNLVCALFGPAIPTSPFNFFILATVPFLLLSGHVMNCIMLQWM